MYILSVTEFLSTHTPVLWDTSKRAMVFKIASVVLWFMEAMIVYRPLRVRSDVYTTIIIDKLKLWLKFLLSKGSTLNFHTSREALEFSH